VPEEQTMGSASMKSLWLGLVLCEIALVQPAGAFGTDRAVHVVQSQAPQGQEPVITTARTVKLTEEDRYTIREVILKDAKVPKMEKANVAIGDPTPPGVTTEKFPELVAEKIPSLRNHTYFVTDEGVVIVDRTNKVADVVKAK
jgi:hypothetical protein